MCIDFRQPSLNQPIDQDLIFLPQWRERCYGLVLLQNLGPAEPRMNIFIEEGCWEPIAVV